MASNQDNTLVSIAHEWDVDSLGDLGDADPQASYRRYEEMVREALDAAYPQATVRVYQSDFSNGGSTTIGYVDPKGGAQSMTDAYGNFPDAYESETLEEIKRVVGRVWEAGAWLVERDPFDAAVAAAADAYADEFPGEALDALWSETGYSDLKADVQAAHTWEEYHEAIQARLGAGE
jgi:hypothetical protein